MDAHMSDWQEERRRRDRARRDEVMGLPLLQVRRHGVIDGQDGDVLVCASVGPAGELVAVWTTPKGPGGCNLSDCLCGRSVIPGYGRGVAGGRANNRARAGIGNSQADPGSDAGACHRAADSRGQVPGGPMARIVTRCSTTRTGRSSPSMCSRRDRACAGHQHRAGLGRVLRRGNLRQLRLGPG